MRVYAITSKFLVPKELSDSMNVVCEVHGLKVVAMRQLSEDFFSPFWAL